MKKIYLLLIFIGFVFCGFGQAKSDIILTSDDATFNTITYNGALDIPENPAAFSITATSVSQMEIALTANVAGDNIVVVFNEDNNFATPSGSAPNIGQAFAGGTVVYKGKLSNISRLHVMK